MAVYTTIDDPSAYFKVQLYTGNGSANHAITFDDTDTDMQPDIVWIKNRDATDSNCLFDSVRGATKVIHPDTTAVESTDTDTLDSFTSDGFQVDADVKVNTNTEKYVAWCWKAGTTSGITTDGNTTITPSSYSFNQTSGVSIINYTGNTTYGAKVAHGLGAIPSVVVVKRTVGGVSGWTHGWKLMAGGGYSQWNATTTPTVGGSNTWAWNDTLPDAVNVTLGNSADVNATDSNGMVGYCFAPKQGFSHFGKWTGNGNADGTFIYLGFRPSFVLLKRLTGGTKSWYLMDTERNPRNGPTALFLVTDGADIEYSGAHLDIDFLSNGFKCRNADNAQNASSTEYKYMAFAEAPLVNSKGVPCNAR